ncbi:MAG TPA: M42 family metallopeptidase, partial [Thermodesulfobacteriota bacterium]|nr:M42 family metallopeptidase [Thermodesulfobacteriota bacterium]
MDTVELLRELSDQFGVSGFEGEIRDWIYANIKDRVDDIQIDVLGNLMATINPGTDLIIMLDAHMDEIGIMVSYLEEGGFLRFAPIGGWDPRILPAQQVVIRSRDGKKYRGVIGASPPHIQTPEEQKQALKVEDLFVDIGVQSKEEILARGIDVGSPGNLHYPFQLLEKGRVMGKALDDRVGCAVLIRCLEYLWASRPDFTLVANFAVSEEVGLRGARTAAHQIRPDLALAIEGTVGADTPGIPAHKCPARLGKGPAISVADNSIIVNPSLVTFTEEVAKTLNIPWQHKLPLFGSTDAGAIHITGKGVLTGIVSVPCRYIHSASSVLDIKDFEHTVS